MTAIIGPRRENLTLLHANNKIDQPADPCGLISAFVIVLWTA